MAELNIHLVKEIKAVLLGPTIMASNTAIVIDPLTESYSTYAPLSDYNLEVAESFGIENARILHNGKNSRFSCGGKGRVVIELSIRDKRGYTAKDTLTITVS